MQLKKFFGGATAAALLALASASAHADFIDLNLAGWKSFGEFGAPANTSSFLSIASGSTVTGFSYSNLSFTTANGSYRNEFVLSVNNSDGFYLDWAPSTQASGGTFGPVSGSWGGATGAAGPDGTGAPFIAADGSLFVTVYESFDDPFGDDGDVLDATVSSGSLRIFYTPLVTAVPEPGTYALMAFGLVALGAFARRRQR